MSGRVLAGVYLRDPVGGAAARRAAREELSRAEYRTGGPGVLDRFVRWLGRLLDGSGPDASGSAFGGRALLIFGVLLLVVVGVIVVRAGVPRRTTRTTTEPDDDPLAPVAGREHRRRADAFVAAAQYALALREYLRAAIATVEERGVLPPRPGRTGAATAREAGPLLPDAAADLAGATTAFDEVWFGGRSATVADCEQARAAADAVDRARIAGADAGAGAPAGLAVPQ